MSDRFLVWLSAGVLTAGVSAATVVGAGVATAQDGAGAGTDGNTTSQSSDSPDARADSGDTRKPDAGTKPDDDADSVDQDGADEEQAGGGDENVGSPAGDSEDDEVVDGDENDDVATYGKGAEGRRDHDRALENEATQDQRASVSVSAETVTTPGERNEQVDGEKAEEALGDDVAAPSEGTITVTPVVETEAPVDDAPKSAPADCGVIETVAAAVSSALTTVLNPLASNTTPDVPAAEPQFWTLAAASRREFENAFVAPSLVEQVVPVENSLTYTPPPTFQDQITMMVYEVLRVITKVTGFNVYATLGRLIAMREPPFFLTWGLDTQRTGWTSPDGAEWEVWQFAPPEPTEKTVVAFHGGGFIFEPNILNWIDYTQMARETGATVIVPLYPLATTEAGRATVVVPEAADFISHQIDLNGAENVSLYADSAGTAIAISAVRELLLAGKPVPSSMVLLSLTADGTLSNPDIREVDDPLFDVDNAEDVFDSHWLDGITDRRDPLVSPLFFETEILKALPPTTIYVGEREILYPDTLLLHQRAVEEGAPISVVVGTGLVHDWPSSGLPLYSATAAVRPDIYRQLGLTGDTCGLQALSAPAAPSSA